MHRNPIVLFRSLRKPAIPMRDSHPSSEGWCTLQNDSERLFSHIIIFLVVSTNIILIRDLRDQPNICEFDSRLFDDSVICNNFIYVFYMHRN